MDYDLAIIGSGPGGYVAAIRAAQLGFKTALIEKYATLGGTCLNVGCIPSKALLDSSEHYSQAQHEFKQHGIEVGELRLNFAQMLKRKQNVVDTTCKGVEFLMKKNKIDVFQGCASLVDAHTIAIQGDAPRQISTKNMILATGSKPSSLPGIQIDKQRIISSTEALNLSEVPKRLLVIGGGIIGLELGSVYARLGAEVTVFEYLDRLIPGMDQDLGKEIQKVLKKHLKIQFKMQHQVTAVENLGGSVKLTAKNKQGETEHWEGDYCLMAVGRKAFTEGLNLSAIDLETDKQGRIPVNADLQTKHAHIYAIGDLIAGPMLAHKAEEDGIYAVEHLAGQQPHLDYRLVPSVLYTWPEAAGVGDTEQALKEQGRAYKSGQFPFRALGRARASGDLDGFVKVLADADSDEILGVHILGARAADLIGEAVVAMEYRASAEDIARISHAHPTFSEAMREACLAATDNRALHV